MKFTHVARVKKKKKKKKKNMNFPHACNGNILIWQIRCWKFNLTELTSELTSLILLHFLKTVNIRFLNLFNLTAIWTEIVCMR
jgi:hypothetical protein